MQNFSKILFHLVRIFPSIFTDSASETEVIDSLETISSIDERIKASTESVANSFTEKLDAINAKYAEAMESNKILNESNEALKKQNEDLISSISETNKTNNQILEELSNLKVATGKISEGKANGEFKKPEVNEKKNVIKVSSWDVPTTRKF
jgi:chromosome segregation ATPase